MKCGELIDYLKQFDSEDAVVAIIIDPKNRLYYKAVGYQLLEEAAALLLEVSGAGPLDDLVEEYDRKCRVCGCTWDNACEGSCYWVEDDLCSKCVGKESK